MTHEVLNFDVEILWPLINLPKDVEKIVLCVKLGRIFDTLKM